MKLLTNGVQNHHGGIKSIGTLVKVKSRLLGNLTGCRSLLAYPPPVTITRSYLNTTQYLPSDHGASHSYSYTNASNNARILHAIIAYTITIIVDVNLSSLSAISMFLMHVYRLPGKTLYPRLLSMRLCPDIPHDLPGIYRVFTRSIAAADDVILVKASRVDADANVDVISRSGPKIGGSGVPYLSI
eukprot:scaffold47667_cov57-Cyclotella_meneghiniana.AAC.5